MSDTDDVDEIELDRARYGKLIDRIGEDPARYLDHDLLAGEGSELLEARVRGIRCRETLAAFRAVEKNLDRGPRSGVLDLLDEAEERIDRLDAPAPRHRSPDVEPIEERLDHDHPTPSERLAERNLDRPFADSSGATPPTESTEQTTEQADLSALTDGGAAGGANNGE